METGPAAPQKGLSALEMLEQIESSIALTDRQRLLVLQTTDLAVATVLREQWPEIAKSHGVTSMIARRMFNHYRSQKQLKKEIALTTISSASGVFQQVLGTYLRAFLRGFGDSFKVALEKSYGKVKPDISIEKDGQPWSAIEVKTDLGWDRLYVSSGEWSRRRQSLIDVGFRDAHLVVLANTNWSGWNSSMESLGVLVILRFSPNDLRFSWYQDEETALTLEPLATADVIHAVEPLFEEIAHTQTSAATRPDGLR